MRCVIPIAAACCSAVEGAATDCASRSPTPGPAFPTIAERLFSRSFSATRSPAPNTLALEHPLDLASRVGHGSVFAISAPLDHARAIMPLASVHRPTLAAYGLDAASILLVENEPSVAQAMKVLLERWGCRVLTAASAGEARDTLRAKGRRPDLIIADLHLGNGERGFDAISAVQSEYDFPVPAFIVTADHSEGASAEAATRGVEILRKPVKPAELRSLMAYLLG
jgi:CheY-like chemotaxis protein